MMAKNYQFDFAIEAMVQQSYMQDRFFLKYTIEEEDMIAAVVGLNI